MVSDSFNISTVLIFLKIENLSNKISGHHNQKFIGSICQISWWAIVFYGCPGNTLIFWYLLVKCTQLMTYLFSVIFFAIKSCVRINMMAQGKPYILSSCIHFHSINHQSYCMLDKWIPLVSCCQDFVVLWRCIPVVFYCLWCLVWQLNDKLVWIYWNLPLKKQFYALICNQTHV